MFRIWFHFPWFVTSFLWDLSWDLCCWVESVESFGCLAYLMVWWWQKPSACIKVDISIRGRVAWEQELQYKLTMAALVFYIYIYRAQQVSATTVSLRPFTPHGCSAPPYERKERGRGGNCHLGLGTWIQSWGALGSSGVKVFSGEFLMFPTSWLFPDFSSASAEMSSTPFFASSG